MHAPRTTIQIINARHVVIKTQPSGDLEIETSSQDPDYDSDVSTDTVESGTDSDSVSSQSTDEYVPPPDQGDDDDSDSCLGLFETSDDDTDDDAESDLSEAETKDGQVDECPVDIGIAEDSQNAMDTAQDVDETDEEDDTIWCQQCQSPRQPDPETRHVLLHVSFLYRGTVHTEKFIIPEKSLEPGFEIPSNMHISKLPIQLYTVVRDSISLESLIGVGAQYEIMTRMFDSVDEETRIPVFTRLGDATPLISGIIDTVITI